SVNVAAISPPVQDSAVATLMFFCLQRSSRAPTWATTSFALSFIWSVSFGREHGGRGREPDDTFVASDEPDRFVRRRFHRDASRRDSRRCCDGLAHGLAMRSDLRRLAQQGHIAVGYPPAGRADKLGSVAQEDVGRRAP